MTPGREGACVGEKTWCVCVCVCERESVCACVCYTPLILQILSRF